jgi:hypothetical protein
MIIFCNLLIKIAQGNLNYTCKYNEPKGKIIANRATQVSGHSLKLYFCMFERSQGKHNSLDCHKNI